MRVTKGQPSFWRIGIAILTLGMSLPFIGWRRPIGRSKVLITR